MSFLRSNICYFHTLSDMSDTCKAAQVFAYTCMLAVNVHKVTVFPYLGDSYLYYVAFSPHQTIENTLLLLPSPPFPFPPFFFLFSSCPWEFNHGIMLLGTFPLCIHVTRLGYWVLLYVLEMM